MEIPAPETHLQAFRADTADTSSPLPSGVLHHWFKILRYLTPNGKMHKRIQVK